jgi:hypothetical protein
VYHQIIKTMKTFIAHKTEMLQNDTNHFTLLIYITVKRALPHCFPIRLWIILITKGFIHTPQEYGCSSTMFALVYLQVRLQFTIYYTQHRHTATSHCACNDISTNCCPLWFSTLIDPWMSNEPVTGCSSETWSHPTDMNNNSLNYSDCQIV